MVDQSRTRPVGRRVADACARRDLSSCHRSRSRRLGLAALACVGLLAFAAPADAQTFIRADVTQDGNMNLDDAVFLTAYLFSDGPAPAVLDAGDVNDDEHIGPEDIIMLLDFTFLGGPFPSAPFPFAGTDPTPDAVPAAPLPTTTLALPDLDVVPGVDDLTLPITLTSIDTLAGIEIAFVHDPAAITLGNFDVVNTILGIAGVEYIQQSVSNDPLDPYAWLSVIADFATPVVGHFIPAGNDLPVARLSAAIPLTASAPQTTVIAFSNAAGSPPKRTVVILEGGEPRTPTTTGGAISIEVTFIRGDANHDCTLDISDAIFSVSYLFQSGTAPPCLDGADTNNDGIVNVADPVYLLNYIFQEGPAPSEPFPLPGLDPDGDALDCAVQANCGTI